MWRLILIGVILLPWVAIAQEGPLGGLQDSLANYQIPTCDQLGCNRQVVEPNATLRKYGGDFGDEHQWQQRVLADARYDPNGDDSTTCTGAVKALFALACGGNINCEIEDEYDKMCLWSSTDDATKKRCVTVVGNYVRQCFGNGCKDNLEGIVGGWLVNDDGEMPFCSGAGFRLGRDDKPTPVMVTVSHCQEVQQGTRFIGLEPRRGDLMYVLGETHPKRRADINPELSVYDVQDRLDTRYPLGYMQPTPFAETVFQGYNRLIASRNKVLERVSVEGEHKYPPLYCDSSPLCTIVHLYGDKVLHTCQSSRGGSGGVLYQKVDGERGIVAVNEGATRSGQVTENEGLTLLRPN